MASQITGIAPVNSPHKGSIKRKMFPFDDVIMLFSFVHAGWNILPRRRKEGTRLFFIVNIMSADGLDSKSQVINCVGTDPFLLIFLSQLPKGYILSVRLWTQVFLCVCTSSFVPGKNEPLPPRLQNITDTVALLMLDHDIRFGISWWRHQMETFSALLAICAENSLVPGEFPAQRPVTLSFDVSFDLRLNKRLSKQWWGWWFETLSHPLWRHRNVFLKSLPYERCRLGKIQWI